MFSTSSFLIAITLCNAQVPGGGDDKLGRGDKQGEYGDVNDEDLERADKGQQDANRRRVQQQDSKEATVSLPGKTEQAQEHSGEEENRKNKVRTLWNLRASSWTKTLANQAVTGPVVFRPWLAALHEAQSLGLVGQSSVKSSHTFRA